MPDVAALVDTVRLLIADTDVEHVVYTDPEVEQFLELEGMHARFAAARALETYAAHIAQVAGPVRGLLDIRVGGEQSANTLLAVADRLRQGRPSAPRTVYAKPGMVTQGRRVWL